MARTELAGFLRSRREALQPGDVGLIPIRSRRRTPGLRREEVAELAGMSVEYVAQLERARGARPSPQILGALAGALQLTPAERAHLFRLAGSAEPAPRRLSRQVRPHVRAMLARMPDTAGIVTAADYQVIAWNELATALLGDLSGGVNLARRRFLRPGLVRSSNAAAFGRIVVGRLRASARRYPGDDLLAALVAELRDRSAEFQRLWAADPVYEVGHRRKTITHPALGPIPVSCDVLVTPGDDQQVVLVTADPGSDAAAAFVKLRRASARGLESINI